MTTKPTTPATGTTSPSNSLGVFDTHTLMELLFTKAQKNLSREELAWIAEQASDTAVHHARNLAHTMMVIGCMANSDGGEWVEDSRAVSNLLFVMSHQTNVVAELAEVGAAARARLEG